MMCILDNFFDDFEARLNYAEAAVYKTEEYDGRFYNQIHVFNEHQDVYDKIGRVIGKKLTGWSILRKGHNPTGWIHADSNCGGYAAVIYMTETEDLTGTAFWSHNKYGFSSSGLGLEEAYEVNGQANDPSKWSLSNVVNGKKNRALIYEATDFHSVYPKTGPADRIVEVLFMQEVD
jgi:hypothetical protein